LDLQSTILALCASVAIAVFCGWRGARKWTVFEGPRIVPWRFLMLLAFAGALFMAKQTLELLGLRPPHTP
jgi:hypothetical protein